MIKSLIVDNFGHVFEETLLVEIEKFGKIHQLKSGEVLLNFEDNVAYMPLLLSGVVKVLREDSSGDELLLYFLEKGDTCAMTITCCLSGGKSEVKAIAEVDTSVLLIPVDMLGFWISKFDSWRSFVFRNYNLRFKELLSSIDNLAFHNMSERIENYLQTHVRINNSKLLELTHQTIASELNTSRVVVSRILKQLEIDKKIKLNRSKIEVFLG